MNVQQFIGLMFLARDVAHVTHLSTRSYAKHKALDEFYHGIVEAADGFAEAYQGRYGLIGNIQIQPPKKKAEIVEFLQEQLDQIGKGRYDICEASETALQNLIDEIISLYLSTIYKLKFLS